MDFDLIFTEEEMYEMAIAAMNLSDLLPPPDFRDYEWPTAEEQWETI